MLKFVLLWLGLLASLVLSGCTSSPLYSFIVYANSEPKPAARLFGSPFDDMEARFDLRAIGSPTSLRVSIYAFYLGTGADCATPLPLIDYGSGPLVKEFYGKPTLFSGSPGAIDYHCAVLFVADTLSFKPDAAAVGASSKCASVDTEYVYDGYHQGLSDAGTWKNLAGDFIPATGTLSAPETNMVALFASTDPAQVLTRRGVAPNQVLTLPRAIQVPGDITIYSNFLNSIVETSGVCTLSGGMLFGIN